MKNLPKGHARVQYKVPESTVQSARVHLDCFFTSPNAISCLVSLPKKLYHCMKPCSPDHDKCSRPIKSELCRRRYNGQEYLEKNITLGQYVSDRFFRPGNLCVLSFHHSEFLQKV